MEKFLETLIKRGLQGVQRIISDNHAGLRSAIEAVFPAIKASMISIKAWIKLTQKLGKKQLWSAIKIVARSMIFLQSTGEKLGQQTLLKG